MKNFLRSTFFMGKNFLRLTLIAFVLFAISLSAYSQYPSGWEFNPSDYEFDGEVTAKVLINDARQESGVLAAFVGNECRGISEGTSSVWGYVFTLRMYSNQPSGETISFKFFDPNNQEINEVNETISFTSDMVVGSAINPEIFNISVLSTNTRLSDLEVDGNNIEGFDPESFNYEYLLPYGTITIPVVGATAEDQNATLEIVQATQIPGVAYVHITAENDNYNDTYSVDFLFEPNENPDITEIGDQQTPEDTPLQLTANFTDDPNETEFDITVETSTENVTVEFPEFKDGSFTYTLVPADNWYGTAEITVTIFDEREGSDQEVYQLTVTPVNDSPILYPIGPQQTNEETTKTLEIIFTDVDIADQHTITVESDNPSVTVVNHNENTSGARVDLIPADAFSGTANITVTVTDNSGESNDADSETFVLTVTNDNDAPIITPVGDQEIEEDSFIDLTVSFTDDDPNDTHTIVVSSMDENVTVENLSGNTSGSTYRLTPASDWHGSTPISVKVSDQIGASDEETYMLTVTNVNDAPVLTPIGDQQSNEDEEFSLVLDASDADDRTRFTFDVTSDNQNVSVLSADNFKSSGITVYDYSLLPAPDWYGTANITVNVSDNLGGTDTETFLFTVLNVNDAPVLIPLIDQYIMEEERTQLAITFMDADPADTFTVEIIPENDNLVVENLQGHHPGATYDIVPKKDFNGTVRVLERVTDADGLPAESFFDVIVQPVNDAPVITNIPGQTIGEGQGFEGFDLNLFASDVDNDIGELEWEFSGNTDLVVVQQGSLIDIEIPDENWNGSETITFTAIDPDGLRATDAATFTVTFFNDPPQIEGIPGQELPEGATFDPISLDSFVEDEETPVEDIQWTFVGNVKLNVSLVNRVVTITAPNENWFGSEEILFTAIDEGGKTAQASATFTLTPVNDIPVITSPGVQSIPEGAAFQQLNLNAIIEDVETPDDEIEWHIMTGSRYLFIEIIDGYALISINDEDWNGTEDIQFKAIDGDGAEVTFIASFQVTPVNDPPVIEDIPNQRIPEGESFADINLNEYIFDKEDESSEIRWNVLVGGNIEITIDENNIASIEILDEEWNGSETVIFTATDSDNAMVFDQAEFTVTPVNDAPVLSAIPDQTFAEGGSVQIDLNAYVDDVETPDHLIQWVVLLSDEGEFDPLVVNISNSNIATINTKDKDWNGETEIHFAAVDQDGAIAKFDNVHEMLDFVPVSITITPVNDPPVLKQIPNQTVIEGTPFENIDISEYFSTVDGPKEGHQFLFSGNNFLEIGFQNPDLYKSRLNEPGITITPKDENWNGSETITFTIEDEGGLSASVDVVFTVLPENDTPTVDEIAGQSINEGASFQTIDLKNYFDDIETADENFRWKISYAITSKSSDDGLDVSVDENGIVSITIPHENWYGFEEYEFTAYDEGGLSASTITYFEVIAVNDSPEVKAPMGTKNVAEDFGELSIDLRNVFFDLDGDNLEYEFVSMTPAEIVTAEIFESNFLKINSVEGASGQVIITVRANDATDQKDTVEDVLTLNVSSTNDAPVVESAMGTLNEDEDFDDITINLNEVFSDSDGEDLVYDITEVIGTSITAAVSGNSLIISSILNEASDGNTVEVSATDGYGETVSDIVTINVAPVNDAPVIEGQEPITIPEDTPYELGAAAIEVFDPDNDYPADFNILITGGANYSVNGQNIVPAANYHGTLIVPVMVNDGELASNLFNLVIDVESVNDQPDISAIGDQLMDEDGIMRLNIEFSDNDLIDTHTLEINSNMEEVHVEYDASINQEDGGSFEIVPDENWSGTAIITIEIMDSSGDDATNVGTEDFVLTVKNVNDKPVIVTQVVEGATQEEAYSTILEIHDIDSPEITFTLVSAPSWLEMNLTPIPGKESVAVVDGQANVELIGTPGPSARDFLLVVRVEDEESSTSASYELNVTQINYPPVVKNESYVLLEDHVKQIVLNGSDNETPDSDLEFNIITDPSNGSLELLAGTNNIFIYTPDDDYFGADFFEYSVTDGEDQSSTARIDLTVEFDNDKPIITADEEAYSTPQDTPLTLNFTADDSKDGASAASIEFEVISSTVNGTFIETSTAGVFTYTPNTGFFGYDKVMLRANETDQTPNLSSDFITRIIEVVRQNEAPIAYERTVRLDEDESATFNFLASDDKTDILSLVYEVVSAPSHATTLVISGNQFTYLAVENYNGTDQFTFRVQDEDGAWSETETVNIIVESVNDVPVGRSDILNANGSTSIDIDFAEWIIDPDTPFDELELEFVLEASNGSAGALGGTMTHKAGSVYTFEQGPLGLDTDVVLWRVKEGDHVSPFYTAEINGLGITSTIKVGIPNLIAVSADYSTDYGSPILIEFVSLDLAAPIEQLATTITVDPTQGSLSNFQFVSLEGSATRYSATYTPTNNADIQDAITFTASDGSDTETATITINISSVDVAPDLTDIANVQMTEDTPVNIEIPFVDPDTDVANLTWTFTSTPAISGLEFTVLDATTSPATIGVTLPQDYTGSSTIEVKLEDNTALFDEIDFTLTVDNVNDAPVLDNVPDLNATEDVPFMYTFTADDVDTDNSNLSYSAVCSPSAAASSIIFSGSQMTFTPAPNYNGDVDVTVSVEDNETPSASDELTFTLSIANENDNPALAAIPDPSAIDEDSGIIQLNITPTDIDIADNLTVTLESSNTTLFPEGSMSVVEETAVTGTMRTIGLTHAENVFGTSVITATVSDGNATTIQQFNITVNEVNDKPVLETIDPVSIEENTSTTVPVIASDVDSPSLLYSVLSNNFDIIAEIVNNGGSYELSIEAQNDYNGQSQIIVAVNDGEGGTTFQTVDVTVTAVDQIPYLANPIADVNANEDDEDLIISLADVFDDPDNDNASIELSIENNDNEALVGSSIDGTDLTLSYAENASGTAEITLKAISNGKTVYDVFNIDVAAVDDAPEVANTIADIDVKMNEPDHTIDLSDIFTDIDNEDASISKTVSNNTNTSLIDASIDGNTLTIEFTPDMHGGADITIQGNSNGLTVTTTFNILVRDNTSIDDDDIIVDEIEEALLIYPIPNNGEFEFKYTSALNEGYIVRIFDLTGKVVYTKAFEEDDGLIVPVNIKSNGKGVYIFQLITDSNKSYTQKIIVY